MNVATTKIILFILVSRVSLAILKGKLKGVLEETVNVLEETVNALPPMRRHTAGPAAEELGFA